MKKHFGWTVYGILGYIFAPMGALFAAIGLFVGQSLNARWQSPEDPVIFRAIFCGVGGIFLLLGLVFLFVDLRRRYLLGRAYNCGNCVDAQVLGMVTQKNVSTFQGPPRMLAAAWTDGSGVGRVYRSRYLYTGVTRLLKSDTVPVYVDRFDENIGFVDIDAVLPEIRVH